MKYPGVVGKFGKKLELMDLFIGGCLSILIHSVNGS